MEKLKAKFASHKNIIRNLQILIKCFFIDNAAKHLQLTQNVDFNNVTPDNLKSKYYC